jgi:methionyl-tRNA synthetase
MDIVSFDEFKKMDLRTATVLSIEAVPNKDKLYKLEIDLGELGKRTIVSGLRQFYSPEQLVGRQIIVIANLAPRRIAGIESHGMLLAVGDGVTLLSLLSLDRKAPDGLRVE